MQPTILRYLSWLVIAGVILHVILFVALHILVPEISPISEIISEYSSSPYQILARAAFITFGLIWAMLAIILGITLSLKPIAFIGIGLLWLAALALIVSAVFPQAADPRDPANSGSILIPIINISRIGLFVAFILISMQLRKILLWQPIGKTLVILSVICVVIFILTIGVLLKVGYGGLGQRILFLFIYAWVTLVVSRVIASPQEK